jgi:hypothetical protein
MSDQPVSETSTYTGQHNIETQETNTHAPSGIRNRDPSNQAAADGHDVISCSLVIRTPDLQLLKQSVPL